MANFMTKERIKMDFEATKCDWTTSRFLPMESSGVIQLPHLEGRLLVINDEDRYDSGLTLITMDKEKIIGACRVDTSACNDAEKAALDDLEGITLRDDDKKHIIYTINALGKLMRFTINKKFELEDPKTVDLAKCLKKALGIEGKPDCCLNVEGLAWDKKNKRLLIGLRNPVDKDKKDGKVKYLAQIVPLEHPDKCLDDKDECCKNLKDPLRFDLDGHAIRDITPFEDDFLIMAGPSSDEFVACCDDKSVVEDKEFHLWKWDGKGPLKDNDKKSKVECVKSIKHAEAVAEIEIDGDQRIILIKDRSSKMRDWLEENGCPRKVYESDEIPFYLPGQYLIAKKK